MRTRPFLAALAGVAATLASSAADSAAAIQGLAPVSVSSANYRTTPRDELVRLVEGGTTEINPVAPRLRPLATPQYFIFLPGTIFDSDLTYEQVTTLLTPALAKKGFINAADEQGIIREPAKVTLVLRLNYGTRLWRLPTVRVDDLAWRDGVIAGPKGVGLHNLGGEQAWDHRAGGNDDALGAIAANDANGQAFSFGSSGKTGSGGAAAAEGTINVNAGPTKAGIDEEYGVTRYFNLIILDAFDYQELKAKGKHARRLWSTFVSAPQTHGQKFSRIAETLIRNATPYFGETSSGLQIYTDRRAEVTIGEAIVVPDKPEEKP